MIVAALWKIFGREELVVSQRLLIIDRVLGPIRRRRRFSLAKVSNVRWREQRVVTKGRSYFRRVVSLDAADETIDVGTQISFEDAARLECELKVAIDSFRHGLDGKRVEDSRC